MDCPDVLKLVILSYLPEFDFKILRGLNQASHQVLEKYLNRSFNVSGIPLLDLSKDNEKKIKNFIFHKQSGLPAERQHKDISSLWEELYKDKVEEYWTIMKLNKPKKFLSEIISWAQEDDYKHQGHSSYYEPLPLFEDPDELKNELKDRLENHDKKLADFIAKHEQKVNDLKRRIATAETNKYYLFSKWEKKSLGEQEDTKQPVTKKRK